MDGLGVQSWSERIRAVLESYDEGLLRSVAARLCKPRNQWPAHELIDRCLSTLDNSAMLDRRLKELDSTSRQLLALIAMSRQQYWPVGRLTELATALGAEDPLDKVRGLLDGGLLLPDISRVPSGSSAARARLKLFEMWLQLAPQPGVFAPPGVIERCRGEALPISLPGHTVAAGTIRQADGLEWPLRLAILWQRASATPFRRTQQGDFFKRDLDRLRSDPLLTAAAVESGVAVPDTGLLAAAWAQAVGVLRHQDGELAAGDFNPAWRSLPELLGEMWSAFFQIERWTVLAGWESGAEASHASTYLLALAALVAAPEEQWTDPDEVDEWIRQHHPLWTTLSAAAGRRKSADKVSCGAGLFLLGIAYPLRLVEIGADKAGATRVRLTALGRWIVGQSNKPPSSETFAQTLLVQPNLEILAYRQGLTPELIVKLTRFCQWQTLGAACTLQLEAASVYRALEAGESYESITQTLERHGSKAIPGPVLDALKTWANKRERISVWPEAVLLEFPSPVELTDALNRGLPAVRLTDRLAAVAREGALDFKHFRLTGTRDYCLPPERCVDVEPDGVTLSVDPSRSDLMLETEMLRFAEPIQLDGPAVRRRYRLTPTSLVQAQTAGLGVDMLATWFEQRTGLPLSPAARLLLVGRDSGTPELRRQLVLHVLDPNLADGLMQWPSTARLIQSRLGPTTLAVAEDNVAALQACLDAVGMKLTFGEG